MRTKSSQPLLLTLLLIGGSIIGLYFLAVLINTQKTSIPTTHQNTAPADHNVTTVPFSIHAVKQKQSLVLSGKLHPVDFMQLKKTLTTPPNDKSMTITNRLETSPSIVRTPINLTIFLNKINNLPAYTFTTSVNTASLTVLSDNNVQDASHFTAELQAILSPIALNITTSQNGKEIADAEAIRQCKQLLNQSLQTLAINFEFASSDLEDSSYPSLERIANVLKQCSNLKIAIGLHSDDSGSQATRLALSQARAESLQSYMLNQGVAPAAIEVTGYGATQAIASNKSATGRAKNRRIEIKITKRPSINQDN